MHGYNKQKLLYPIYRNPDLLEKFQDQITHNLQYQDTYSHVFEANDFCKHGNQFDPSNDSLVKVASTVTIYHENIEEVRDIDIYARKSAGNCSCLIQPDLSRELLWNLGGKKLISYTFLNSAILKFVNGHAFSGQIQSRAELLKSYGADTTLTKQDFRKAVAGL